MLQAHGLYLVVVGFSLGALLRSSIVFGIAPIGFMLLIAVIFLAAYHFTRMGSYLLLSVLAFSVMCGALRTQYLPDQAPPLFAEHLGRSATFTGVVASDPDIRETSQRISVFVEDKGQRTTILAIAPLHPTVSYGEEVTLSGGVERPEPFATDGGRTFRYDQYLAKDGIFLVMPRAKVTYEASPTGIVSFVFGSMYSIKRIFVDGLGRALPEPHAGLASGILVGGKQGLGERLLDAFTNAGLIHIVVLSGYNVMIVAIAIMRALSFLPKRAATVVAALSIGLFVIGAGAGAASVRAGLMAGIGLFARSGAHAYTAVRALAFVVLLMLIYNPLLLAYDIGFQFSVAATLGLILWTPHVLERVRRIPSSLVREIAASTIAAQLGVLPLLLYHTGNLSLVAIPANLLALPAVPIAMLLSFVAGVAGILIPYVAPLIGVPAYLFLSYLMLVGEYAASLPFSHAIVPAFGFMVVCAAYGGMAIVLSRLRQSEKKGSFKH